MAEWRDTRLGDVIQLQRGFDLPSRERIPGSVPIVSSGGVSGVHREARAEGPGVVTGRYGTLGQVFYLSEPFWPLNTTLFVKDFKGNDPLFISYLLRTLDFLAYSDKAAVPGVNRNHLHEARVFVPPVVEQRRIAGILGALDDKIELNRAIGATLEGLARVAYAELQATRSREWTLGSIADVALNPRDQVDPSQVEPSTPYIGLEHVPRGRMVLGDWARASAAESGKMAFQRNDILFGKLRPYFQKVGVVPTGGICSTDIIVIRPTMAEDRGYVLAVATDPLFIEASNAASTGTRMPRTSWTDLTRYPLPIPPPAARAQFTERVWPLIERAQAALSEIGTLEQLRDTLLPRLLSGDIEVAAR